MSDYTVITDFGAKDALASGNPAKRALGAEVAAELNAIATAITSKANTASPVFTGDVARFAAAANPGWQTGIHVLQLSAGGAVHSNANISPNDAALTANLYYDGATWRRIVTGEGAIFDVNPTDVAISWAASGSAGSAATDLMLAKFLPAGPSFYGNSAVSSGNVFATLDADAIGDVSGVILSKNALSRWAHYADGDAESGGDVGSPFRLASYDDAGVFKETVLTFVRNTGLGAVKADPTDALGIATKQYVDAGDAAGAAIVQSGTLSFAGTTVTAGTLYAPATQSIGTVAIGDIVVYEVNLNVTSGTNGDFYYSRAFTSGFASTEGFHTHRFSSDADLNGTYSHAQTSRITSAGAGTVQPVVVNAGGSSVVLGSITVTYAVIRP